MIIENAVLSFSLSFFGIPSGNTHGRDARLAITALNRFAWLERSREKERNQEKERKRDKEDWQTVAKKEETVGPHWLRLDDLAFLGEETRGDLGSRPPLRRYGYAEVSDNGTSSTLSPVVFSFLPPCAPTAVSSSSSSSFLSSNGVALAYNHFW